MIKTGDLVVIARRCERVAVCSEDYGLIFVVGVTHPKTPLQCQMCGMWLVDSSVDHPNGHIRGVIPISWLRKIEPPKTEQQQREPELVTVR